MPKQTWKGSTLLNPAPAVLVSCGDMQHPNLITIAWAGTICTQPSMVSISVRPERHSYKQITESGQFVINLPTAEMVRAVDWCGVRSGRDYDKFAEMGLHAEASTMLEGCPVLAESPINLECKLTQVIPLGTHDLFLAEVVAVNVDESLLDENGKLCMERANLIVFSHGEYFTMGEVLGSFGYSVRKKPIGKTSAKAAAKPASQTAGKGGKASGKGGKKPIAKSTAKAPAKPAAKPSGKPTRKTFKKETK